MQRDHGTSSGGRNHPPEKPDRYSTEGRDRGAFSAGARVERFIEKNAYGASETASGISSRTSALTTNSPAPVLPSSKTVAFSKPTSTVIPVELSQSGGWGPSNSSVAVRTSSERPATTNSAIPTPAGNPHLPARFGPRLRAEGLMVPPASDAATLRRQVAALQIDLEAHIDGEQRLQSINQQLRERLELYMKQNHENVERAESELNILHEDMEQTLELQRRLAQRATALEKEKKDLEQLLQERVQEFEEERAALQIQISTMSDDLRGHSDTHSRVSALQAELDSTLEVKQKLEEQLKKYSEETEQLKKKTEEYSAELGHLLSKEQRDREIDKLGQKAQLRRQFGRFQEGIQELSIENGQQEIAENFYAEKCALRGLRALRLAAKRSKQMRLASLRQAQECVLLCWKAWRMAHIVQKKHKDALKRRAEGRVIHAWHSWKTYVIRAKINPQLNQLAFQHWRLVCLKRMLKQWREASKSTALSTEDERRLSLLAKRHLNLVIYKRSLGQWLQFLKCWARPKRKKLATVQAHINNMTMKGAMAAWRGYVRGKWVKRMKFEQACIQDEHWCRRRTLQRLREALKEIKYRRRRAEMGNHFRIVRLKQLSMKSWHLFVQHRRHGLIAKQMAFRHYLHDLRAKAVHVWRDNVAYLKAKMRATMEVNEALMRAAMVFWKDFHAHHAIKKKKMRRALINKARREIKTSNGDELATGVRPKASRPSLQTQFEEQKHQVTAVDVENLQLIDRLHTMSSEIAFLKTTINEKEKQEEELHRALEDSAVLESSMRGEIEQQHIRADDLEQEINALQKKLQLKNAEDTAGEVHHTLEIQNLGQALKELRIQIAEKNSQLESYEKALKETAEKLEGASDESQEKLTSAFEIAASLRKLLEERENQFATLEGNCRRRELELGEVQRKLAVANCTLCETVEARDSRIQELESLLTRKHSELQESQQQLQELELILDCKDSRVRKLEYENKLLAGGPLDTNAPVRVGLHNINVKEALRGGHGQAKDSMGTPPEKSASGHAIPSVTSPERSSCVYYTRPDGRDGRERQSHQSSDSLGHTQDDREAQDPLNSLERHLEDSSRSDPLNPSTGTQGSTDMTDDEEGGTNDPGQHEPFQTDWETSFALVSTARPPAHTVLEPSGSASDLLQDRTGSGDMSGRVRTSAEGPFRMVLDEDPGAVDSLHVEIQRLQARIMSRLKDSPSQEEGSARGTRQHGSSSSRHRRDSRDTDGRRASS
ncbi:hypothetical protein AXG93_2265s1170 [Marchantia polymorpha subsp. ruderalis]|uniref:Sfi1 spindle body domain-containing protein n=1 Tax=Marchantia polymorpha subsp. ruderalis TaxID=1480154 RepID=A0A176WC26_MARPO|nr:hypothetical protein AXG93_2265s1170 [Marchantia polymorpha subsp. ruderalis]